MHVLEVVAQNYRHFGLRLCRRAWCPGGRDWLHLWHERLILHPQETFMSEAGGVPMGWHKSPFEGYAVTVRRPAQCRQQLSSTCLPAPVLTDTLFSARSEQHGAPRGSCRPLGTRGAAVQAQSRWTSPLMLALIDASSRAPVRSVPLALEFVQECNGLVHRTTACSVWRCTSRQHCKVRRSTVWWIHIHRRSRRTSTAQTQQSLQQRSLAALG